MLQPTREQLERFAHDVAVLWDEAQTEPQLLRFLAPFGRPDLGRIVRTFRSATTSLVEEQYPVFSTWLAAMLARDGAGPTVELEALSEPQWSYSMLTPSLRLGSPLALGARRLRTLVVAGSLEAPVVHVNGQLIVAGDLTAKVVVSQGCLLVGGALQAELVSCAPSPAPRDPHEPARPLGFQVGRELRCRVLDSPRFAVGCPLDAEVVVRAAGRAPTADAATRLRALLVPEVLTGDGVVRLERARELAARGLSLFLEPAQR
ncbi:MAG: hypothetical protein ACOZQL_16155 [Myxococcota bacterium]